MTAVTFETYGGTAPENYERYFVPAIGRPVADDLIDRAALRPGERVLDVACGTGVVTRLAAEQVTDAGSVAGLDINPGMIAVARSATPPHLAIDWHEGSAEAIPLPDGTFDVVLCQMGLQFMADKAAALREMRRVLAPGGRLLVNLPGPTPPALAAMAEALGRHIAPPVAGFVHMVFSLHDQEAVRQLIDAAGFRDVVVDRHIKTLRLPPPEHFLWQYVHSTPMSEIAGQASGEARAAVQQDVVDAWQPFVKDDTTEVTVGMLTAIARTP